MKDKFPMKVLLLSDVYKQGVAGEVVTVSDGYARNYLLPKKLAVKASPGELKRAEKLRETAAARKAELEGRLNDLARQIDGVQLVFGRRAANTGKLFGSVTTSDIADALNQKTGIDINRRRISQQALREIGSYDIPVRLGTEISPVLKVTVVREDELAAYLAAQESAAEAAPAEAGNVIENAVETVREAAETVVEAVTSAVESAVEAVKEALSPDEQKSESDTE
jgi:large subunit ribosomal protein L9